MKDNVKVKTTELVIYKVEKGKKPEKVVFPIKPQRKPKFRWKLD